MALERNIVGWFEIPVKNMERALVFYQQVLRIELARNQLGPLDMAWFPWINEAPGAPGALVKMDKFYKPSKIGVLVYLTAPSGDLANELSRVDDAGGTVLQEKKQISEEYGYMGLILDSEGNRIALHSRA